MDVSKNAQVSDVAASDEENVYMEMNFFSFAASLPRTTSHETTSFGTVNKWNCRSSRWSDEYNNNNYSVPPPPRPIVQQQQSSSPANLVGGFDFPPHSTADEYADNYSVSPSSTTVSRTYSLTHKNATRPITTSIVPILKPALPVSIASSSSPKPGLDNSSSNNVSCTQPMYENDKEIAHAPKLKEVLSELNNKFASGTDSATRNKRSHCRKKFATCPRHDIINAPRTTAAIAATVATVHTDISSTKTKLTTTTTTSANSTVDVTPPLPSEHTYSSPAPPRKIPYVSSSEKVDELNRKVNALIINIQSQNKKIEKILRVCDNKDDEIARLNRIARETPVQNTIRSAADDSPQNLHAIKTMPPYFTLKRVVNNKPEDTTVNDTWPTTKPTANRRSSRRRHGQKSVHESSTDNSNNGKQRTNRLCIHRFMTCFKPVDD